MGRRTQIVFDHRHPPCQKRPGVRLASRDHPLARKLWVCVRANEETMGEPRGSASPGSPIAACPPHRWRLEGGASKKWATETDALG